MNGTSLVTQLAGAQPGLNIVWTLVMGFVVILVRAGFARLVLDIGGRELGLRSFRGIFGPEVFTPAVAVFFLARRVLTDTAAAVSTGASGAPRRIRLARARRLRPIEDHLSNPCGRFAVRTLEGLIPRRIGGPKEGAI
jgi:hypothetical protein